MIDTALSGALNNNKRVPIRKMLQVLNACTSTDARVV